MEPAPHILVVDDDRETRELLARFLGQHGCKVLGAAEGREMRQALRSWRVDLVVLDLMLPGDDGLVLCRELRAHSQLPVIMLTAVGEEVDRIIGLEVGADDYLPKPFNPRELLARIRAVLRRTREADAAPAAARGDAACFAGWRLELGARRLLAPEGHEVPLTSGELQLLRVFVERPQRTLSRDQILDLTRGREAVPFDRSVDVQVSRLRRKLERNPSHPELIKTVRADGYVFTAVVERR
ncbi:MAG TPA: response regulator [Aggregicoccus sp.]|nr:response regulator [Aggregicoccus sp.]